MTLMDLSVTALVALAKSSPPLQPRQPPTAPPLAMDLRVTIGISSLQLETFRVPSWKANTTAIVVAVIALAVKASVLL